MNWFEILTGFTEDSYAPVQDRLQDEAIERALGVVADTGLDVRIVEHREVSHAVRGIIHRWNGGQ
jgi:hypothetical protein